MPPFRLSERTGWTTMRISAEEMQCYSKANVSGNGVLLRGKCMYNIERQAVSQAFGKIGLLSRDTRLFIGKWVPSRPVNTQVNFTLRPKPSNQPHLT